MQSFATRTQSLSLKAFAVISCEQYQIVEQESKIIILVL